MKGMGTGGAELSIAVGHKYHRDLSAVTEICLPCWPEKYAVVATGCVGTFAGPDRGGLLFSCSMID
jgi:hypothetical protein